MINEGRNWAGQDRERCYHPMMRRPLCEEVIWPRTPAGSHVHIKGYDLQERPVIAKHRSKTKGANRICASSKGG